jgi:cytochrome oxidase Cu insertion factor (SCO1/SenC/PrrC family)
VRYAAIDCRLLSTLLSAKPGDVSIASPVAQENALQRAVSALFGRRLFWVFFVLIGFSWPLARVVRMSLPEKLPELGAIGPFELRDQEGRAFGTADLAGRVWVMSAVKTSTPAATDLVKILGKIQHRARNLGVAFHLVTVGVDPDVDTPERLRDFTHNHRVSPRIWSFVSGDPTSLRRAQAALGLEIGGVPTMRPREAPAPAFDARGGPMSVAVVDGKMRVRGWYDLGDPKAIDTVLYHVGLLVNRGD